MTNQARLARQGKIFNHDGKCGRIPISGASRIPAEVLRTGAPAGNSGAPFPASAGPVQAPGTGAAGKSRRAFKPVLNEVFGEFASAIKHAQSDADLQSVLQMINLSQGLNTWEHNALKQRAVARCRAIYAAVSKPL